ncbi:MAB_1171c family putative transporter [Plantactinospora sp. KBS50]|uniref:MAB_1171c family putative transporter n=1 Tax=Plantactinospora sp. KBS50 TaxID=2024580 RepID=UPI000BAAD77B|nr:MAB_1171c family putative transporter [Plantactinospora sp. KBS50]ASW57091.1 hypothetical protein CIK06_27530 [Plantactinospora sp. KBS50]
MNGVLYPVAAAVAWSALLYRLGRGLRQDPRDPALYAVCTAFALMGLVFTVSTPAIWSRLDGWTGIPNLSLLVSQSGVIAFSGTIQCLIIFWTHPGSTGWRRARWRLLWVVGVLVTMAVLFSAVPPRPEQPRVAAATYAAEPTYGIYLGCYLAMVAVGVADIIRLCLPYARDAGRTWLSRGLRLTATGAAFGVLYCVLRTGTVVAALLHFDQHRWEFLVPITASLGALLIIVGLTLPALGPRMFRVTTLLARRRAYQRLRPLWEAVAVTMPEVVLDRGGRWPAAALWDLDRRLRRRVIEIGDGIRGVRDHLDESAAAEPTGGPDPAVRYAGRLRAALVAFEQRRRADLDAPGPADGGRGPGGPGDPTTAGRSGPEDAAALAEQRRRVRWDSWYARLPRPADDADDPEPTGGPPARGPVPAQEQPAGGRDFAAEVNWLVAVSAAMNSSGTAAALAQTRLAARERS